jgi:transcriptional regulator with XRE-family HTH domain
MEVSVQIGNIIKGFREAKNFSQEKLAEKSLLSLKTIYRIENGLIDPKLSTLISISKGLEISLYKILLKENL